MWAWKLPLAVQPKRSSAAPWCWQPAALAGFTRQRRIRLVIFGQGIALAARAGAALADMEFVQFHPTALASPRTPLALISEAVRGEGAQLRNERGERFMADVPGAELAPRDVVARAISAEIARGGRVFLDARPTLGNRFAARFPSITALCQDAGIDPAREAIPVRPAVHYHMGGVATDLAGRTRVEGLWAVGEVAATGLHGANRLASNSLLEATVMGLAAAEDIARTPPHPAPAYLEPVEPGACLHPMRAFAHWFPAVSACCGMRRG